MGVIGPVGIPSGMLDASGGYEELEHTADVRLRVWALDFEGLLTWAVHGMFSLCGMHCAGSPRQVINLTLEKGDPESMLVDFLNELLYACETRRCGPKEYHLRLNEDALEAEITVLPLISQERLIKAATYHDLQVLREAHNWQAVVVFDV